MPKISTILCPVDLSDPSLGALEHAEDLARKLGAELVVAHIVEPAFYPVAYGAVPVAATVNIEEEARKAAEDRLQQLAAEITGRGVPCSPLVDSGTAALRICELVKENGIDLVVIATHGYTGLKHVLLGSVAERVVRMAECPVLSVKSHELPD